MCRTGVAGNSGRSHRRLWAEVGTFAVRGAIWVWKTAFPVTIHLHSPWHLETRHRVIGVLSLDMRPALHDCFPWDNSKRYACVPKVSFPSLSKIPLEPLVFTFSWTSESTRILKNCSAQFAPQTNHIRLFGGGGQDLVFFGKSPRDSMPQILRTTDVVIYTAIGWVWGKFLWAQSRQIHFVRKGNIVLRPGNGAKWKSFPALKAYKVIRDFRETGGDSPHALLPVKFSPIIAFSPES